jgi:SAM-dependent methyltransferases related to tRNA (uracil-5-)-methyltransferase
MLPSELFAFIQEHLLDEPERLLLSAGRYPGVDVRMAAQQIAARQHIREKLPEWYAQPELFYPSALSCQQASSELTARYKQHFVPPGTLLYDLTGGLGVDSYYLAQKAGLVTHIEHNPELHAAAKHNFRILSAQNIRTLQGDCRQLLSELPTPNMLYIDPSRRGAQRQRLLSLQDYEPDLDSLQRELFPKVPRILLKISPMADIWESLRLLPETIEVHVLSVKNDCKELLFLLAPQTSQQLAPGTVKIVCAHLGHGSAPELFEFQLTDEIAAKERVSYAAPLPQGYLYEPSASLLKAGAFCLPVQRWGLGKLSQHSHLYTSPRLHADFCGRIFRIIRVWPFHNTQLRALQEAVPQAHIAVRHFPLGAEVLRKRLKVKDGGDTYLFGTTLANGEKVIIEGIKPV